MLWIGDAAASSNTVWQKLLPLLLMPPGRLNRVTVVPDGEVRVAVRSPTQVWSMPTVVAPTAAEQAVPSIENVTFERVPTPETGIETDTPAALASGIAAGGPA